MKSRLLLLLICLGGVLAPFVAESIDLNLARCSRLRQAVLKRAFEGRLVPAESPDAR